jgi:hypothetical protein
MPEAAAEPDPETRRAEQDREEQDAELEAGQAEEEDG